MPHLVTHTISAAQVSADLTDFPAYADTADWYLIASFASTTANGGGDIRVFLSDDTTELAREVVDYDSATGAGEVWFKIPFLSSSTDTVLHIYADGTSADYAVTDPFGRNNVWNGYHAVYHLRGVVDTSNATGDTLTDISTVGGGISNSSGPFGGAINLDGSSTSYLEIGSRILADGSNEAFTMSAWVRPDSITANHLIVGNGGAATQEGWALYLDNSDFNTSNSNCFAGHARRDIRPVSASNSASAAVWHHVSLPINQLTNPNTQTSLVHVNGASSGLVGTGSGTDTAIVSINSVDRIGASSLGFLASTPFDGQLSEVRIASTDLSSDWIATEYANQSSPSTFYSVAANDAGGVDNVTPTGITTTPSVGTPEVGQIHSLTATGIQTTPTVGNPAIGQVHNLTATGITVTPTLGTPTAGETSNTDSVTPLGLTTTPTVGTPSIGQVHTLTAVGIETTPVLGRPTAGSVAGVDSVTPTGLTVTPTVGTPQIGQIHALSAVSIDVIPEVGTPAIGQVHALVARGVQAGVVLGAPVAGERLPDFQIELPPGQVFAVQPEIRVFKVKT